ncbi:hypothetical protein OPV22_023133 [Ensete ventricosum]|uniref:GRAM domain-containing protein n=1 Tax=Ensete ventricosum TaxID=4639 RepID=A0AAV8PCG6_ENSVE|nr:hypothetical protein OPV22_023133 [Ensete ventricosum]
MSSLHTDPIIEGVNRYLKTTALVERENSQCHCFDGDTWRGQEDSGERCGQDKTGTVRDVLDKFGKKVNEAAKKIEDLAGNFWQHLKTGPSIADAAMGRISQTTRVISEGGYDKIFWQTFETFPDEKLKKSYACYLSTSAGPVMGVLYLSTAKLAFCSDNPQSYKVGDQTQCTYYKVVIPLHQKRSVDPSASRAKPGEKYIQVVSIDNHEFWFMVFMKFMLVSETNRVSVDKSRDRIPIIPPCGAAIR